MQHLTALLLQLLDKISEVTLFVRGTRRGSFFFMRQTQHKFVDVIETWAVEAVLVVFLFRGGSRSDVGVMDSLVILSLAAPATPSGRAKDL